MKFKFSILIALVFSVNAHAQGLPQCKTEAQQFCSGSKDPGEVIRCLVQHDSELSKDCKADLQRLIQASKQASARGGGALGSFGGMASFAPPVPVILYEGRSMPGGNGPSMTENRLNFSLPVYVSKEESVSVSVAGGDLHLSDGYKLNNGHVIADDWYRGEIGVQYSRKLADKKTWGLKGSVGLASDVYNVSNFVYSGNAYYGFPTESQTGYWILMLFYANNSPLLNGFPIPGAVYMYRSENFTGLFGFPITSMQWTLGHPWSASVSIFGPIILSELAYGDVDKYQIFAGFSWNRVSFVPSVRVDDKDRLTFEDKKVTLGVRTPVIWNLTTELQVGESFNRSTYIGTTLGKAERGFTPIPSSIYYSWNLRAAF